MSTRIFLVLFCAIALPMSTLAIAQSYDRTEIELFKALNRKHGDLARYEHLTQVMPHLSASEQVVARQLVSAAQNELGLYDQAILGFPLKSDLLPGLVLPSATEWQATDAVDAITKLATDRHIVMINEAHHDAHTRQLTLALLPRLRKLGFNYFAAEALGDKDPGLMLRGYPVTDSGTEYLHEPLYGEIVREAIHLGFTIIPYDAVGNMEARETGQADNLYRKVFAKDPQARLFVQCGYAHVDKGRGRLADIDPLAMRLQKKTGFDPLSIDQTQFLEIHSDTSDAYHQLTARFRHNSPFVLTDRANGKAWSASPADYDVNVILPRSVSLKAFGKLAELSKERVRPVEDATDHSTNSLISNVLQRPAWLTLGGTRQPVPINATLCRVHFPCVVEAQYANESEDAIAADRYAFMEGYATSKLYLFPGRYRLRVIDDSNKTLSERVIDVAKH